VILKILPAKLHDAAEQLIHGHSEIYLGCQDFILIKNTPSRH